MLTVAVFVHQIQNDLWRGFYQTASKLGVRLIFFTGRSLESPYEGEKLQNKVYHTLDASTVDGIIFVSGILAGFITRQEYLAFLDKFTGIPAVSLSLDVDGMTSIRIDNYQGMRDLVRHFISIHSYKTIAFIRGPKGNYEAEDRYKAYLDEIKSADIKFNKDLVYLGDFRIESGRDAVKALFRELNLKPEAIISANDNMAIGAAEELGSMGVQIPVEVALGGFDNIRDGLALEAPLTTIDQGLERQAVLALESLYSMITKKSGAMKILLPVKPLIRSSCGCSSSIETSVYALDEGFPLDKLQRRIFLEVLLKELKLEEEEGLKLSLETLVQGAIEECILDKRFKGLSDEIQRFINMALSKDVEINQLALLFQAIRNGLIATKEGIGVLKRADRFYFQCQTALDAQETRKRAYNDKRTSRILLELRNLTRRINAEDTLEAMLNDMVRVLPSIGIKECLVYLYPDQNADNGLKLVLAIHQGQIMDLTEGMTVYDSAKIGIPIKSNAESPLNYVVFTLSDSNTVFGYAVFEFQSIYDTVYEYLREQMSSALKTIRLYEAKDRAELSLRRSEEKYRSMAEFLPALLWETDSAMNIRFANKAARESFGLQSLFEGSLKESMMDYVPKKSLERVMDYANKALAGSIMELSEFDFVRKDGIELAVLGKAGLIEKEGRSSSLRWSGLDIRPLLSAALSINESFVKEYGFTPREKDVLKLWVQGHQIKEIAAALFIAESTVKIHIGSIYARLNVKNKSEFYKAIQDYQKGKFGRESIFFTMVKELFGDE